MTGKLEKPPQDIRIPGIDFIRAVAVFLMFTTHVSRLKTSTPESQAMWPILEDMLRFFMRIEPFTFALFVFLAGFGVVFYVERLKASGRPVFFKLAKRAAFLAAISATFFFAERGPQWPDILISTGPLLVIATASFAVGLILLMSPHSTALLIGAAAMILVATLRLEASRTFILAFNAGEGALMSESVFAFYGALVAKAYLKQGKWGLLKSGPAFIAFAMLGYMLPGNWVHIVNVTYEKIGDNSTLWGWIVGSLSGNGSIVAYQDSHWHYTAVGALRMLFPLYAVSILSLFTPSRGHFFFRLYQAICCLGRRSLHAYVFHLTILAAMATLSIMLPSALWTWALIITFCILSTVLATLFDNKTLRWSERENTDQININDLSDEKRAA